MSPRLGKSVKERFASFSEPRNAAFVFFTSFILSGSRNR